MMPKNPFDASPPPQLDVGLPDQGEGVDASALPMRIAATEGAVHRELVEPIVDVDAALVKKSIPGGERFIGIDEAALRPAPQLGEHGRELLAELGYDRDAIATLRATQAI